MSIKRSLFSWAATLGISFVLGDIWRQEHSGSLPILMSTILRSGLRNYPQSPDQSQTYWSLVMSFRKCMYYMINQRGLWRQRLFVLWISSMCRIWGTKPSVSPSTIWVGFCYVWSIVIARCNVRRHWRFLQRVLPHFPLPTATHGLMSCCLWMSEICNEMSGSYSPDLSTVTVTSSRPQSPHNYSFDVYHQRNW